MEKITIQDEAKQMINLYLKVFKKAQLETRRKRKISIYGCREHRYERTLWRVIARLRTILEKDNKHILMADIELSCFVNTKRLTPKPIRLLFRNHKECFIDLEKVAVFTNE